MIYRRKIIETDEVRVSIRIINQSNLRLRFIFTGPMNFSRIVRLANKSPRILRFSAPLTWNYFYWKHRFRFFALDRSDLENISFTFLRYRFIWNTFCLEHVVTCKLKRINEGDSMYEPWSRRSEVKKLRDRLKERKKKKLDLAGIE